MAALQKLKYGLATGTAVLLSASSAFAQEADAVHETKKITSNFVTLIKDAFAGGEKSDAAMKELMGILAPAVLTVAVCWISYIIASAIGRYIGNMVATKVDLTLGKFLTKAIRNLLMIVVAMGVLSYVGVDITGFAAALAAVSFAVGMALQGTLGNFASGVMLLLFRPFKVEDYIVVSDTEGTVEEIDLFTTRINTLDNRHVIVPNGEIFGSKLENYTRNELRRVDVSVGAEYSADLDRTRQALERAVMSISESEVSPPPQVYLVQDWAVRRLTGVFEFGANPSTIGVCEKNLLPQPKHNWTLQASEFHSLKWIFTSSARWLQKLPLKRSVRAICRSDL